MDSCAKLVDKIANEQKDLEQQLQQLQAKAQYAEARKDKAVKELEAARRDKDLVLQTHMAAGPASTPHAPAKADAKDGASLLAELQDFLQVLAAKQENKHNPATEMLGGLPVVQQRWEALRTGAKPAAASAADEAKEQERLAKQQEEDFLDEASQQNTKRSQAAVDVPVGTAMEMDGDEYLRNLATLTGVAIEDWSEPQKTAALALARSKPQDSDSLAKRIKVQ